MAKHSATSATTLSKSVPARRRPQLNLDLAEHSDTGSHLLPHRGRSRQTLDLLGHIKAALEEVEPVGVRGVAYYLFTRRVPLIASMATSEVNKVGRILKWAREDGDIPWAYISDDTRPVEHAASWRDSEESMLATAEQHRKDRWTRQPRHFLVVVEKNSIAGVLRPLLEELGVDFQVFHGFGSATAVHAIAEESTTHEQPLIILYIGDWDPSGLGMSELDLPERFERYGGNVELRRVALVKRDLRRLPSFSVHTKRKDPRYAWFRREHGDRCWEVDAMNPNALRERVREAIEAEIDWPQWERDARCEKAEIESLYLVARNWKAALRGAKQAS